MFTTSVRRGKAFVAEQKIKELKDKNIKVKCSKTKYFSNENNFKLC